MTNNSFARQGARTCATTTLAVQPGRLRWLLAELAAANVEVLDYYSLPDGRYAVVVPDDASYAETVNRVTGYQTRRGRTWQSASPVPRILVLGGVIAAVGGALWVAAQVVTFAAAGGAALPWAALVLAAAFVWRFAVGLQLRRLNASDIETGGFGAVNLAYTRLALTSTLAFLLVIAGAVGAGLAMGVFVLR